MTDLVERLPKTAGEAATMDKTEIANACITAAAEIEWLRSERDRLAADLAKAHKDAVAWMEKVHQPAAEIERLREAARGLYDACERRANAEGGDFGCDIGPAAYAVRALLKEGGR